MKVRQQFCLLFILLNMSLVSCSSLIIEKAIKKEKAPARSGRKTKTSYTVVVAILKNSTISKVSINDLDVTDKVVVYRVPSGEILPINNKLIKGKYNLSITTDKFTVVDKKDMFTLKYVTGKKLEEVSIEFKSGKKIFSK